MKKIFLFLFLIPILTIISIAFLEILSRNYQCQKSSFLPACDGIEMSMAPEEPSLLINLKNKRRAGEEILKKEYQKAMEELIREVPPERLPGLNGVACLGFGLVRRDLPKEAKKYVRRHELEHLLGEGDEFRANMAAGREYPLGLILTIFFSLKDRTGYYDSPICYISTLWKTFKIYFLP